MNGHKLMKLRLMKGLSQPELAKEMGTNATIINRLESGKNKNPTNKTMMIYCNYFNISPFDFIGGKEAKNMFLIMIKEWVDNNVISEETAEKIYKHNFL